MGKTTVHAWQEFKKMGNRAPDNGGAGEEDFPLCPLPSYISISPAGWKKRETIFFLFIYNDHLTCEKKSLWVHGFEKVTISL